MNNGDSDMTTKRCSKRCDNCVHWKRFESDPLYGDGYVENFGSCYGVPPAIAGPFPTTREDDRCPLHVPEHTDAYV